MCAVGLSTADPGWLLALGLATAALMAAAASRRRRVAGPAWYALAGAAALFTVGDYVGLRDPHTAVGVTVALFLPAYLLAGAGLWRMITLAPARRRGVADVVVLAVGLLALLLRLLLAGGSHNARGNNEVVLLFPLADLMLAVLAVRLVSVWRRPSSLLLAAGTMFLLGLAAVVTVLGYTPVPAVVIGLRTSQLTCWALAAMTPSVRPERPHPATRTPPGMPYWPLALVVLLPPIALLVEGTTAGDGRSVAIAAVCAVAALFVLGRIGAERKVSHLSDPVTGLATMQGLHDAAATALATAGGRTVAVFFIDIVAFHTINDTLGTPVGDQVLAIVAKRAGAAVDSTDKAARLNADRFAVLDTSADAAPVEEQAARIQAAIQDPLDVASRTLTLAGYIGFATSDQAADADELLGNADLALHAAKVRGPGHAVRYEPALRRAMEEPTRLRGELPGAIRSGQLFCEYQPIVELVTGRIEGFEALVRWQHPELGRLAPDRFIHVAETAGCIDDLGAEVLRRSLRGTARLNATAGRPLFMDINVSPRQLFDTDALIEALRAGLAETALDPSLVVLELTESGLGVAETPVEAALERLRETGARLAIDDFGTGYSSLSRLRDLPIDAVKIDKSFVSDLHAGPSLELVAGIVTIARSMDLKVIAEGVESVDIRNLLIEAGCGYGQGYLFSRPVPLETAVELLGG